MGENCFKALYVLQPHGFSPTVPLSCCFSYYSFEKHLYWCFGYLLLQNKLLQNLRAFFKNDQLSWFWGNHKIMLPIVLLGYWDHDELQNSLSTYLTCGTGCQVGAQVEFSTGSLFSSPRVSPHGYLGLAKHGGRESIRNVQSCRSLKASPQKYLKSPLLYYIGPNGSKNRLCLLMKGVAISHWEKTYKKGTVL